MNDAKLSIYAGINNIQLLIATIEMHRMGLIKDSDYIEAMRNFVGECGELAERLKADAEAEEADE